MSSSKKDWLKPFIESKRSDFEALSNERVNSNHPEFSLYRAIQPTGLMYGQTVGFTPSGKVETEKIKLLLVECLISSSIFFSNKPIKKQEDLTDLIDQTLENIREFYNSVFPEVSNTC